MTGTASLTDSQKKIERQLAADLKTILDSSQTSRTGKSAIHIARCCQQFLRAEPIPSRDGAFYDTLTPTANRLRALADLLNSHSPSGDEIRRRARDLADSMIEFVGTRSCPEDIYLHRQLWFELDVLKQAPTGDDLARDVENDIEKERRGAGLFGAGMIFVLIVIAAVVTYPLLTGAPQDPANLGGTELLRLVGVVPLTLLAAYLSKQAAERAGAARRLRGLRLQLTSLHNEAFEPESVDMNSYRRSVYDRLYTAYNAADEKSESGSKSLVEQLNETMQKLIEALPTSSQVNKP